MLINNKSLISSDGDKSSDVDNSLISSDESSSLISSDGGESSDGDQSFDGGESSDGDQSFDGDESLDGDESSVNNNKSSNGTVSNLSYFAFHDGYRYDFECNDASSFISSDGD